MFSYKALVFIFTTLSITSLAAPVDPATPLVSRDDLNARAWDNPIPGVVRVQGVEGLKATVDGKTLDRSGLFRDIIFANDHRNYFIEVTNSEYTSWRAPAECAIGMGPGYSVSYEFDLLALREAVTLPFTKEVKKGDDTLSIVCYKKV
ncbi:uncharacterized protein I303_106165 [Kwoniella dejecticola CBS 10117]|uniref:Uncharacterized protein n=1 Tax=Kwoniella dejecticola CBS 10117 TaxID=1296121 RepID=A0A1A6A1G5_9TREE|nr:uncharacterized protein I303_06183 [Kwoniella dejecticola CBS 10117]OBR83898.1 hypothetical protein I303_06183 [Kwoniella dejecticola CBS 10117]